MSPIPLRQYLDENWVQMVARAHVTDAVCAAYDLSFADLCVPNRTVERVEARQLLCVFLREMGMTYTDIAVYLERDHSTIMHAVRRFRQMEQTRPVLRYYATEIRQDIARRREAPVPEQVGHMTTLRARDSRLLGVISEKGTAGTQWYSAYVITRDGQIVPLSSRLVTPRMAWGAIIDALAQRKDAS